MDKLEELFKKQIEIQKLAFNANLPEHRPDLVSYFALGLFGEVGEVLQADKTWKPFNRGERDEWNVPEEIADCWLFLINLTLAENIDVEMLFETIKEKQNIVYERIKKDNESKKERFLPWHK